MSLDYESTANGATAQYNGNIAAMQWRTNVNGSCMIPQQYRFSYDYTNRLLSANHHTHNGFAWVNTNNYSESNITYDFNGNIKTYTRRGLTAPATYGIIDQLTYTYGDAVRPDRLTNMAEAGSATKGFIFTSGAAACQYDLNGNLTQDNHKALSLTYNYLNLPNYVVNPGGAEISITYTADGEKLTKLSTAGTRNYITGIEYLGANLEAIYHGEGRCTPNGTSAFYYEYTIKDHLGNARINFRANGTAVTFQQELHYYPFGMLMEGIGTAPVTNNGYKYNGKELNEDLGLNLSDYGARWYDAAVGRWWSIDPMGDVFPSESPYVYAGNSPVTHVDIGGYLKYPVGSESELSSKFPEFTKYLKSGMSQILGSADIISGLKVIGGYTEQQINEQIIQWGEGIEVDIHDLNPFGECNEFNGMTNGDKIVLEEDLIYNFETASSVDKPAALLAIFTTLLHETIHVGQNTNNSLQLAHRRWAGWPGPCGRSVVAGRVRL